MTSTFLSRIRDADWLDAPRARAYPRIIAGVVFLALLRDELHGYANVGAWRQIGEHVLSGAPQKNWGEARP